MHFIYNYPKPVRNGKWVERFIFIAGRLCVDFTHTGGKTPERAIWERLLSPDDLADWLLISPLKLAGVQVTSIEFQSGLILREAIWSSINLIRLNQNPVPADIKIINQAAAPPDLSPVFDVDHFNWTWLPPITATAALSTISRDAIDLFSGRSRTRIRKCENPKCGLFFVDQSHPGHRRWCLMERCGNMEKTTRYRHQHTTSQQDES